MSEPREIITRWLLQGRDANGPALDDAEASADVLLVRLDEEGWDLIERDGPHYIDVTKEGWSIQHPARCRPNLLDCTVHHAVDRQARDGVGWPLVEFGRYLVELDGDGFPVLRAEAP